MKIEIGDKVKIIGDCGSTNASYSVVEGMKEYIYTDDLYTVDRLLTRGDEVVGVRIKSYSWHVDDIMLIKKSDGTIVHDDLDIPEPVKSRSDFFKFDDSSIKSIIT